MNKRSPYPSTRSPRFPNTQPTTMRHGAVLLLVILSVSSSEAQVWKKIAGIGGKISDISNGSWTKLVKNYVKSFFDNLVERAEKAFVKFTSNCEYLGGKSWSKNDDKNWNETNKQTAFFFKYEKNTNVFSGYEMPRLIFYFFPCIICPMGKWRTWYECIPRERLKWQCDHFGSFWKIENHVNSKNPF